MDSFRVLSELPCGHDLVLTERGVVKTVDPTDGGKFVCAFCEMVLEDHKKDLRWLRGGN